MYSGLHVKCPIFLFDFNQICIYWQILTNPTNIKFHRNPLRRSLTDTCGQTDMMKLTGTYHEYANAPKKLCGISPHHSCPRGLWLNEAVHRIPMHVFTQCVIRQKHITCLHTTIPANNITSQPFIKWLQKQNLQAHIHALYCQ